MRGRVGLGVLFSFRGLAFLLALALVFLLCVYPLANLFAKVTFRESVFSLQVFADLLRAPSVRAAFLTSLIVGVSVTGFSLLLGVGLAWLLTRWDLPAGRWLRSWLSLPYAIPPYVGAIAWIFLANPTTGFLNQLLGASVFNVYSLTGLIFVETSFLYTFVFLSAHAALERMDSSLEEAARLSGATPGQVFRHITLPILRPALVSGGLLVFLAALASFGVPALLGGPARLTVVTTLIYNFMRTGSILALLRAAALSFLLMVAALILLALARAASSSATATVTGKTARPSRFSLGRMRWPVLALVLFFICLVFGLPLFGILLSSVSHVQGEFSFANFTLENWQRVLFATKETPVAITNSLLAAAGAATLASVVAFFVAYIQVKTRLPGRRAFDLLASIPYATPGTVIALALIMSYSVSFLGVLPSLYNTLGLILIAYFVKYVSFSVKTMTDGYAQLDDVLAEAAHLSGANWWQVMRTIWFPLLRPAIFASWLLVFMPALSEMTMTLLLTGPGLETIGTLTFQLQEYADASGGSSAVLALLVVFAVMALNSLVKKLSGGKYGL